MKPHIQKYIFSILIQLFTTCWCSAQFTSANVTDIAIGSGTSGCRNTGCDILDISGQDLFVAVWDSDNNTSSIYSDDNGTTGIQPFLYTDAQDPDVALITDGVATFAVVVYYTNGTGSPGAYVAEIFAYSSGVLTSSSNITLLNNINIGSSINVDGNRNGDFIVVFQKDSVPPGAPSPPPVSVPVCVTGHMVSNVPAWYFTTPIAIRGGTATSTSYIYSDVCIWDSVSVLTDVVYFSYKNNSNGDIIVQEERWQNLDQASPTIIPTTFQTITPGIGSVIAPRIACTNGSASRYDMTVVYSDGNDVESWTYFTSGGGGSKQIIWTDDSYTPGGGVYPLDVINGAPNTKPVVTYDGSGNNNITIAWVYNNSAPTYGAGFHPNVIIPIGLVLDVTGTLLTNDFLDVPRTINTDEIAVSVCGRFSSSNNNIGVVWFDDSSSKDIYYKLVQSPQSSFRNGTILHKRLEVDKIQIYDFQGRLLRVEKGNVNNINEYLKTINLHEGVYIIKSINKSVAQSQMYFVQ